MAKIIQMHPLVRVVDKAPTLWEELHKDWKKKEMKRLAKKYGQKNQ